MGYKHIYGSDSNAIFLPNFVGISDVRLAGNAQQTGKVEVLYNGLWRVVCGGDKWSHQAAWVVCRKLGYPGGQAIDYSEYSINDNGRWKIFNVQCGDGMFLKFTINLLKMCFNL